MGREAGDLAWKEEGNVQSFEGKIFPSIPWKISSEKDEMRDPV